MNQISSEISRALIDVRKGYRLLHDYQRSALDAARYIGDCLGFNYVGGYTHFGNSSPANEKVVNGGLAASAWDWLNLYFYDFHFMKEETEGEYVHFCILLFSDTGYYQNESIAPERDMPTTYPSAEQSETKVGFLLYSSWEEEYDSFFTARDQVRDFLFEGKLPPLLVNGEVRGMVCDFSCLASQESADRLVMELRRFGEAEGFLNSQTPAIATTTS